MISQVAASERETAQTGYMSSPEALYIRCRGAGPERVPDLSGSYKTRVQPNPLESGTIEGESPVGEGLRVSLGPDPKYRGTRGTLWELMRTIS